MRILISNSDTIGDFVLRQPLYAALAEAGHELAITVRSFVAPLAQWVAPNATVLHIVDDPYAVNFNPEAPSVQQLSCAARALNPDLFVIAAYQRTILDEVLASCLSASRIVGLNGYLYPGPIDLGVNLRSAIRFDTVAEVSVDSHELHKSQALCSAVLRRNVRLPYPSIPDDAGDGESAVACLDRLGFRRGDYWVACVGDGQYRGIRNWGLEEWAQALAHLVERHCGHLLMVGTSDEYESTEEIRLKMGEKGRMAKNLCGASGGIETLASLISMSRGYIGRDTGPMHLAAALNKPVIAVFGCGNWPRFTPTARSGVIYTTKLACAGCNWICHLSEPHCIRRVPVAEVIAGIDDLTEGRISGLDIRALEPDRVLLAQIITESSSASIEARRRAGRTQSALRISYQTNQELSDQLRFTQTRLAEIEQELATTKSEFQNTSLERAKLREELENIGLERNRTGEIELQLSKTTEELEQVRLQSSKVAECLTELRAENALLKKNLAIERNRQRVQAIDAERLIAKSDAERRGMVDLVFELQREIEMLCQLSINEVPQKIESRPPGEEITMVAAIPTAFRRILSARGSRFAESLAMASAGFAMIRRRLKNRGASSGA